MPGLGVGRFELAYREMMGLKLMKTKMYILALAATAFFSPCSAAFYNLHLSTDNGPDYNTMESFVRTATGSADTPQDKCIAVWRWGRRSRRQTSCARDGGRLIWDPILHYNSYGTMNCGVISALNIASFLQLGYKARYIQLGDHTVSEVSWDDGATWHLFDSSMSFFCYNHKGEVASCEEIKAAHGCERSGGKKEPGHFYLYHGAPQCTSHTGPDGWRFASDQPVAYKRTLENGASSYTDGFSVSKYTQYARWGRRYILNVLPYQSYTRYWKPVDGRIAGISSTPASLYYRPLRDKDPDAQHNLHNIRGNGVWVFQPDLASGNCREVFYDSGSVKINEAGDKGPHLGPEEARTAAFVVFQVSAANVITSMKITAQGVRKHADDMLRLSVSRTAGITWSEVWNSTDTGNQAIECLLHEQVAGVTDCLLKCEMSASVAAADVGLNALKVVTITQVNRRTLPKLTLGTNRVSLSAGEQLQSTVLWPELHAGRYRDTVSDEKNVFSAEKTDGIYKATIGSAVNGEPCFAAWTLRAPTELKRITYGVVATNRSSASYISLQHRFKGQAYSEFFRKSDGAFPFDRQVIHTVTETPPGTRTASIKCEFFSRGGAATYGMDGIQELWIRAEHAPRTHELSPLDITYNWTEHRERGDVTRSHTERVDSLPHHYTINTAGFRDPTMNWVRVQLRSFETESLKPGYSDGRDVGSACEPARRLYLWGENAALGKPYEVDSASSNASGNPDSTGRELTNGVIIAPTDYTTHKSVQKATAFWAGGTPVTFVIDLGTIQKIEGVRICTHQPNEKFCHPATVEVSLSKDNKQFEEVGLTHHNDLWKSPTDYEPWEHDDSPRYDKLPAGGRLAYRYPVFFDRANAARYVRFRILPLPGRGIGLSELEVFRTVGITDCGK